MRISRGRPLLGGYRGRAGLALTACAVVIVTLGLLAFPSGHTTSAAALTATLAVVFLTPPQQPGTRIARVTLVSLACVITGIVATGVIGLRWHYFTDTVAGAAVGVGSVLALALILDTALRVRDLPSRAAPDASLPGPRAQPATVPDRPSGPGAEQP